MVLNTPPDNDGAHCVAMPEVGCAQAIILRGAVAVPAGKIITPETGMGFPSKPVEAYRIR
jgi:hypothetical protein